MSARDAILADARRNAPAPTPLPALPPGAGPGDAGRLRAALEASGARVVETDSVAAAVRRAYPEARQTASAAPDVVAGTVLLDGAPHALASLDLFVCRAVLGVAENGAVWLPESHLGARAAPFLAPHVAVVLSRSAVVATMHDAYRQLDAAEGFGVFVAGPSKTADIEQSLVVGAHGPLSLTVFLTP